MKKLISFTLSMLCFGLINAQNDSLPQDSLLLEKSTQKIYFGLNLNGGLPINHFTDNDQMNPVAGSAEAGYGAGLFANFYWDSGIFMKINADYQFFPSTFMDAFVNDLNSTEQGNPSTALDNPEYHHFSASASGGYNIALEDVELYVMGEVGYALNHFTNSAYRTPEGFAINFDASSDPTLLFGAGIGAVFKERISLELAYINLGEPIFEAIENDPNSLFPIAVEFLRAKLGVVILR